MGRLQEMLANAGVKVDRFVPGEQIFLEGDPGDSAFVIRSGSVDITSHGPDGEERLLQHLGSGELFGEMALLDQMRRSASAFAREESELFVLTRDEMMTLLEREPQMAVWMLRVSSRRLRVLTRLVAEMEQIQEVNLKILAGQEEERRRISRDIHDGLAQSFADSILRLQSAVQLLDREPKQARSALGDLENGLRDSLGKIRDLISNLFPRELRTAGLVGAIGQFLDRVVKHSELRVSFEHRGLEDELPAALESTLYCIVQEALYNVRKHAGAAKVQIDLDCDSRRVRLTIEDDGCGFDPKRVLVDQNAQNTYGLLSMQERAELAGGTMEIDSRPGAGTKLSFFLPARAPLRSG